MHTLFSSCSCLVLSTCSHCHAVHYILCNLLSLAPWHCCVREQGWQEAELSRDTARLSGQHQIREVLFNSWLPSILASNKDVAFCEVLKEIQQQ